MKRILSAAAAIAVFSAPAALSAKTFYQDLHDFAGGADGDTATSDLMADRQGRLYGTTYYGGTFGDGTLFRVTLPTSKTGPAKIEILHSFQPAEGVTPIGGVVIGTDGGLYGATNTGGAHNAGTIYRVDPANFTATVLHDFNPGATPADGSAPHGGLAAGPGGLLYGTTAAGGPLGYGTVFAISPKGDTVAYSVIHAFGAGDDGDNPYGRLAVSGNNLFGTSVFGGPNSFGVAFQLTLTKKGAWAETGLYEFGSQTNDAIFPPDGLALAKSGLLYGCAQGGSLGHGAAYQITPAKGGAKLQETVIYSFGGNSGDPADGGACSIAADKTGRLVGVSSGGGTNNTGTVFTLTPSGGTWTLAVPYSFGIQSNGDAVLPNARVIGVKQGYYVGTAPSGGADNKGVVYRVKF